MKKAPEITLTSSTCWTLYFDGACEPINPGGTASYGYALYLPNLILCGEGSGIICKGKEATNNLAEFTALEMGLIYTLEEKPRHYPLLILGDSMLVVMCINNLWNLHKPHLSVIRERIFRLLNDVPIWELGWIPREENEYTDQLSKKHCEETRKYGKVRDRKWKDTRRGTGHQ